MRKLLLLILLSASVYTIYGQTRLADSLKARIDSLERKLADGQYIRVPNKDFDNIIDNKIRQETYGEVNKWVWIIGTFFGAMLTLLTFYFHRKLKDEVNTGIINKSTEFTAAVNAVAANCDKLAQRSGVIEKKIENSMDMFWDEMANVVLDKARNSTSSVPELETKINHFLVYEYVTLTDKKQIQLIDALMRLYYYSTDPEKYKKMIVLLKKYEDKFDLQPETYANAAIALSNTYELHGLESDRVTCIENCDKSISRLKDYGVPYAVKLEVYMIEYTKAFNDEQRTKATDNILRTFKSIENNQPAILSIEILERLGVDRNVSYLKQYIDLLEQMFFSGMNMIRERALKDLLSDYSRTINKESNKKLLTAILQHGLNTNATIIDGKYTFSGMQGGNKLTELFKGEASLEITGSSFIANKGSVLENGLLYFLTGNFPLAVNFYSQFGNKFELMRGIYKIDSNILSIAFSINPEERPDVFDPSDDRILLGYSAVATELAVPEITLPESN